MGMAASQARFLGVTARKSNVEYEGQQINQQRTALANQSANLYNQMLGLDVPVPPNKSDAEFTKTTYTFTDDTGATATINSISDNPNTADKANWPKVVKFTTTENVNKSYRASLSNATITNPVVAGTETSPRYYNEIVVGTTTAKLKKIQLDKTYMADNSARTNIYNTIYNKDQSATEASKGTENLYKYDKDSSEKVTDWIYLNMTTDDDAWEEKSITDSRKSGTPITKGEVCNIPEYDKDGNLTGTTQAVLREPVYGDTSNPSKITGYTYTILNVDETTNPPTYSVDDSCTKLTHIDDENEGKVYACGEDPTATGAGTAIDDVSQSNINNILATWATLQEYDEFYTYQIGSVDYYIPESMVEGTFSTDNFQLKGNPPYSYYNQTVQQDKEKVMEANPVYESSTGRLQSITLKDGDDAITCSVTTNSVTDEDAYNDAMNQYTYDYNEYEKTIADINAQTEVIQAQDRELELRLKQLDTEQEALTQEMDAIKKVIDKNTETTFKTFA